MFVENPSAKPIETPKEVRCRQIPAKRLKNSFKTPNNSWSCVLLLLRFPCCTTGEIKRTRPPSVPHRAPTHLSPGDLTTALPFQRALDPTAVTVSRRRNPPPTKAHTHTENTNFARAHQVGQPNCAALQLHFGSINLLGGGYVENGCAAAMRAAADTARRSACRHKTNPPLCVHSIMKTLQC
jgi:hypothetical protein